MGVLLHPFPSINNNSFHNSQPLKTSSLLQNNNIVGNIVDIR